MPKQTRKEDEDNQAEPDFEDIQFEENTEDRAPEAAEIGGKLKKLRDELKVCHSERAEYLAGWQRAKADYLNLKKEAEEQRGQTAKWVKEGILEELLMLADSFELAMANQEVWEQAPENWRKGVEYIYLQLKAIFQNHNLEVIEPKVGDKFNPLEEHSVAVVPAESPEEDDKVDEIIKKGYKINGRVLRPAQVKVRHWSTETKN